MNRIARILCASTIGLLALASPSGPVYDLSWHTIDGGGGLSMGGTFDLYGVIGQPDAGATGMTGGAYSLSGGFLSVPPTAPCPADSNGSGTVDVVDLLALLGKWGPCPPPCPEDNNQSGTVDVVDLLALLGAWGACP